MHENFKEISLEEFGTMRNSESLEEPFRTIFQSLALKHPELANNFSPIHEFLYNFVYEKEIGVVFFHEGKRYVYRVTKKDNPKELAFPEEEPSWSPVEHIVVINDCLAFFQTVIKFSHLLEERKSESRWVEHMTVRRIWERMTLFDFAHPTAFLRKIIAEVELGDMGLTTEKGKWKSVARIKTRRADEQLFIKEVPTMESYMEGPQTLHFSATTSSPAEMKVEDEIHSVVYGRDSENEATI